LRRRRPARVRDIVFTCAVSISASLHAPLLNTRWGASRHRFAAILYESIPHIILAFAHANEIDVAGKLLLDRHKLFTKLPPPREQLWDRESEQTRGHTRNTLCYLLPVIYFDAGGNGHQEDADTCAREKHHPEHQTFDKSYLLVQNTTSSSSVLLEVSYDSLLD
ncbi:MAG: hypothetical protein ABW277_20870, partial [Longimicrobiaceae bacterium]